MIMMQKQLDVVLVNPGGQKKIYQSLSSSLTAYEPPVWAGLMASYLRKKGLSVSIIDANVNSLSPEEVAALLKEMKPVLVSVVVYGHQPSASTQHMPAAGAICKAIKEIAPELKVLMVGGHVASLPQRTLDEEATDYVSSGEGLFTMHELVQALKNANPNLNQVRDLWYRDGGVNRFTAASPLVKEIETEIPGIAWDLLPMEKYRAHNWHCFGHLQRQPYAAMYTTLGCPYHCSFCCIQAPFKSGEKELGMKETVNSYRAWSPKAVVEQIDLLVTKYGVRNIKIADEMFVLKPAQVLGICDLLIERGYDLNIWAYARVDTVRDNMVDKLKKAGFHWLAFGIEAASERVRADVDKGFNQKMIYDTLHKVRSAGINVIGNYIFGLPEDDYETMQATLDLAMDLNCEFGNFYCAMAYPGSPLYNMAVKEGWSLPDSWSGYSQHAYDSKPLPTKYLTTGQVLKFRDEAFQKYFNNPAFLDMISKKFNPETARHIQEMTVHKLERKYA